jgi:hypothetical protein
MGFEQDIVPPLSRLAKKLIEHRAFAHVESTARILDAICAPEWRALPPDERAHWLDTAAKLLGADGLDRRGKWTDDADHRQTLALLDAEREALRRRMCA